MNYFKVQSIFVQALIFTFVLGCASVSRQPNANHAHQTQITGWNFDWDDNIMYMPTPILLYKNGVTSEDVKNNKVKALAVSTENFTEVKSVVGPVPKLQGDQVANDLKPYTQYSALPESYYFFRDHGTNDFKKDIQRTIELRDTPPGTKKTGQGFQWKGPSFEAFQTALSDAESAKWTSIITARGHSSAYMMDGIKYLQEKGFIKLLPKAENVYAVTNPDFSSANPGSPSAIKVVVMKAFLDKIAAVPVNDSMVSVLNPDGTDHGYFHLWGFSDDDYENYMKAKEELSAAIKLNKTRWANIKITLFYSGRRKHGVKAHSVVIKSDGEVRPRVDEEIEEVKTILALRQER